MAEGRGRWRLGPFSGPWWRIWVLAGAWALGAGIVAAAIFLLARWEPRRFEPGAPAAIAVRVRDAATELSRGSPQVAAERLQEIRYEDPLNPYVHALLGQALGRVEGRLPDAIAATRLAVTLDPNFADAWYNMACLYGRAGDRNGAVRALAEAAAAGFSDREALAVDPDLALIRDDPRVAWYLSGAAFPAARRFGEVAVVPPVPRVGEPFDLVVRLWSFDHDGGGAPFALTWLGPSVSRRLRPVARTQRALPTGAGGGRGWELRFRVVATAPFVGGLGPWDLRIGGERVSLDLPALRVEGSPQGEGGLRPPRFFVAPIPPVSADAEGWTSPWDGAFSEGDRALVVTPWPAAGPPPPPRGWDGAGGAPASYDEWIIPAEGAPAGYRRVFDGRP